MYIHRCSAQIDNSGRVWFESGEKLTSDSPGTGVGSGAIWQVYERTATTTRLVSIGPDGLPISASVLGSPVNLNGVSPDGSRIYLSTYASLVPEDTDDASTSASYDSYELANGRYTLLTTGPLYHSGGGRSSQVGAAVVWASDDGAYVYFVTGRRVTSDDTDPYPDVYARIGGETTLVSTGPAIVPPGPSSPPYGADVAFLGASTDGATAYFASTERLTADDPHHGTSDIFAWRDGTTTRVTRTQPYIDGQPWTAERFSANSFGGAANNGSFVFLAFSQQIADDTDGYEDLYIARPDGTLQRPAAMAPSTNSPAAPTFLRPAGISEDGSRIFLTTTRSLLPTDTDQSLDAYMLTATGLELITPLATGERPRGEEELHMTGISRDGRRAFFTTWAPWDPADVDDKIDVYEWDEGRTRLVSPASDGRQSFALFAGVSPNGRFVAIETFEPLIEGDQDADSDIYLVDMGAAASGTAAAASANRRPGRRPASPPKRAKRKLRLVTAEAIAPRMAVSARATYTGPNSVRLSLGCPKSEKTGPCRGRVRLLHKRTGKLLAKGKFRIAAGRRSRVTLRAEADRLPARPGRAIARVRGADALGNAATRRVAVSLKGASGRR